MNTINILGKEYNIDEIKGNYKKSLLGNIYKVGEIYKPDPLKRNLSDVNKEITEELLNNKSKQFFIDSISFMFPYEPCLTKLFKKLDRDNNRSIK